MYTSSEIDENNSGIVVATDGVISAAIRKLEHELGIPKNQLPQNKFKFLTRLHYWAADVLTHGSKATWGENEIDYILFIQADVNLSINKEEVADTKYVSLVELQQMMDPSMKLLWSPWFRIIAEKFLPYWWADLHKTLHSDALVEKHTIFKFDPSKEFMGGAGNAKEWLGTGRLPFANQIIGDITLKQGAYGKVIIHKHSKLEQLMHFDEIFAALWFHYVDNLKSTVCVTNKSVKFCQDMLGKVSRSFASVIRQLPEELCMDVLIFYLALRALDTIEDDMEAFKGNIHKKIDHLNNFYKTALITDGWSLDNVGFGDEKVLLQNYFHCVTVFKSLSLQSQEIITDIAKRMGQGMAYFVERDLGQGTKSIEDYNLYCHYVAGLVGEGLSRLFSCSGYESQEVASVSKTLANTMGLFLQKTNIIRDYLEDFVDGRAFWPQEVWKKYSVINNLGEFADISSKDRSLSLLNELVTDALECVPYCLDYMELLQTEEVFRFCAIPQVMAIATLNELYNNYDVFTGVVKIRKGLAAKLILDTKTKGGLHKWFNIFSRKIASKIPPNDPNFKKTRDICEKIIKVTDRYSERALILYYSQIINFIAAVLLAFCVFDLFGSSCFNNSRFQLRMRAINSFYDFLVVGVFTASSLFSIFFASIRSSHRSQLRKVNK